MITFVVEIKKKMYRCLYFIICLMVFASSMNAQNQRTNSSTTKKDGISSNDTTRIENALRGKDNIQLNNDVKNSIDFNFFGNKPTVDDSPFMESPKSWMKFNDDATKSIMYAPKSNDLRITMKINPNSNTDIFSQRDLDIKNRRVPTNTEEGDAMLVGTGISFSFDAEKLLYENLTERGRNIKHNRKYANAWKNYKNFIPEKDSIQRDSTLLMQDVLRIANDLVPLSNDSIEKAN